MNGIGGGVVSSLMMCVCVGLLMPGVARAAGKDACSLVSAADAQAVLGEPVGPAKPEGETSAATTGSSCRYRSTVGKPYTAKSLSFSVHYGDVGGSQGGIAENLKTAGFKNVHEVAGVGSAAVWGTNSMMGRTQGELTVLKGGKVMLVILVTGLDEGTALDRAKALAAKVLPQA